MITPFATSGGDYNRYHGALRMHKTLGDLLSKANTGTSVLLLTNSRLGCNF